jgi:hypothetical protein
MDVSHKQCVKALHRCWQVKQPLFIHGTIGIGKSQMARQLFQDVAKEQNREFIEWVNADEEKKKAIQENVGKYLVFVDDRVALKDSTDNKGVPKLNEWYLKWVKSLIMNISAKPNSMVIWFKDELNLAPPSVQSAEYQIILDRALDDLAFAPNTYVFAAGNRQEDRTNVFEMSWALKNRFAHVTLMPPSLDDWCDWAYKNGIDTRIPMFLQFKRSFLFKMDVNSKEDAFPTPRAWEFVSNMIKGIKDEDELLLYISQCVGYGVAREFVSWYKLKMKVNIDEIMENPEKIKGIKEIDVLTSTISGVAEKYTEDKALLEKALGVVTNIARPEMGIHMARLLASVDVKFFMVNSPKTKYMDKIMEYKKYIME